MADDDSETPEAEDEAAPVGDAEQVSSEAHDEPHGDKQVAPDEHPQPKEPSPSKGRKTRVKRTRMSEDEIRAHALGPDRIPRLLMTFLFQLFLWGQALGCKRGSFDSPVFVIFWLLAIAAAIIVPIMARAEFGPFETVLNLLAAFSTLIAIFTTLYWSYGTAANFNQPLTRLDAIYFAVGTLSTAGTGNLVATSEVARGMQTGQMLLDIVLVAGAVTVAINALMARASKTA